LYPNEEVHDNGSTDFTENTYKHTIANASRNKLMVAQMVARLHGPFLNFLNTKKRTTSDGSVEQWKLQATNQHDKRKGHFNSNKGLFTLPMDYNRFH
jgi:hypothetical protein